MELTARQKLTFGRRLEKLEKLLGEITPDQYGHEAFLRKYDPKHPTCGTVACALGWAVASKRFRGLDLKPMFSGYDSWAITSGGREKGIIEAAEEYFGPESYGAIFDAYAFETFHAGEVTAPQVRERIREVAEEQFGYTIPA